MIFLGIAIGICLIDLLAKTYVERNFSELEHKEVCNERLILTKVHNKGMMMNFLDQYPKVVEGSAGIVGIFLSGYFLVLLGKSGNCFRKLGIACMVGGAWSNIYDRFTRKYVVDYICFKTRWKKLNNIVFNIGDLFIFLGCILTMISSVVGRK
ncbi:MAG: signal peptidase II [Lachnospiraceae bacterium]